MKKAPPDPDQRSPQEAARIRDESIRRMMHTPPRKHSKDEPKAADAPKRGRPKKD